MKVKEVVFDCTSRSDSISLYVLGDIHVGALDCEEAALRRTVKRIADDPKAYWFGGGDYCDAVILKDTKRFDPNVMPAWMLTGGADKVRKNIKDMLAAQRNRFYDIMEPIKDKCLGCLEGNHEYSIMKHHNRDHQLAIADHFEVEDLTDCAFIRLKFRRQGKGTKKAQAVTVRAFLCHGGGGGRTYGAEPNKLARLAADKDCDIILTGHTHSFCINAPMPRLYIPSSGQLYDDPLVYHIHSANWGTFLGNYKGGPSTYGTRALYPARALYTVETVITPFATARAGKEGERHVVERPKIEMHQVKL